MFQWLYSKFLPAYSTASIEIQKKAKTLLLLDVFIFIFLILISIVVTAISYFRYFPLVGVLMALTIFSLIFIKYKKYEIGVNIIIIGFILLLTTFKIILDINGNETIFWYLSAVPFAIFIVSLIGYKKYQPIIVGVIGIIGIFSTIITLSIKEEVMISLTIPDIIVSSLIVSICGVISILILSLNKEVVRIAENETEVNKKRFEQLKELIKKSNEGMQIGEHLIKSTDYTLLTIENINESLNNINKEIIRLDDNLKTYEENNKKLIKNTTNVKDVIEEQTTVINQSASSIGQMTDSINRITEKAKEKNEIINQLSKTTNKGQQEMEKAVNSINKISESTSNILNIIKVIVNIADQTNLLAMNASIESARAGNMGTGFSVVAGEIRKLAENTTNQTKIISQNLEKDIDNIKYSVEINKRVGTYFQKISEEVRDFIKAMEEIIISMTELSNRTKEIMNVVSNLLLMSEKTSTLTKNMEMLINSNESDIQRIFDLSKKNKSNLENIVNVFKSIIQETKKIQTIGLENIKHIETFDMEIKKIESQKTIESR